MGELEEINKITEAFIGTAIEVHDALGPGLLESAYQACLSSELLKRGHKVEQQRPLAIRYKNVRLDCGYRLDLVIDEKVIVEIKSVDSLAPIHEGATLVLFAAFRLKSWFIDQFQRQDAQTWHLSST